MEFSVSKVYAYFTEGSFYGNTVLSVTESEIVEKR
jgi:hypothetical protein